MKKFQKKCAGIILAAGKSSRMGTLKSNLKFNNKKTFLTKIVDSLRDSGIVDIFVVAGYKADEVQQFHKGLDVRFVFNPDYEKEGQISSLKSALRVIGSDYFGTIMCLIDHPAVTPETISKLIEEANNRSDVIVIPRYCKKTGHPVYIGRKLFPEIINLKPDYPLNRFINRNLKPAKKVLYIDVADKYILQDIDTQTDYLEFQKGED